MREQRGVSHIVDTCAYNSITNKAIILTGSNKGSDVFSYVTISPSSLFFCFLNLNLTATAVKISSDF